MPHNGNNKESMKKTEIAKILEWHNSGTLKTDEAVERIFSLFNVRLSFVDWLKENEPLLVNHGGKLNIHEIEQRYTKYINEA